MQQRSAYATIPSKNQDDKTSESHTPSYRIWPDTLLMMTLLETQYIPIMSITTVFMRNRWKLKLDIDVDANMLQVYEIGD